MNANQKVELLNEAASLAGDAFEKLASKAPKSMTYDDAITIIVGGMDATAHLIKSTGRHAFKGYNE